MGSEVGLKRGGGFGFPSLIRRKQLGSVHSRQSEGQHQLAKELTLLQLISIGVGSTIGAGVYVIVGTVAREHSGPALTVSFIIAGIAIGISALCYAELASRCPSAGSAYHYSYVCVGEGVAWLIGWSLILENTIGGSAVARGISPNLALLFGGENSLPFPLARTLIPGLNVVVDPCAAILVLVVTGLFCTGIKESSFVQAVVTTANLCVMAFVIIVGGYLGFQTGWAGYELPNGYFPFGVNGVLAGSATVFFAYIGFDSITTCAEEVKNPQRDLPLSIGVALSICCALYMLVSAVIVGLVPYYAMDPDTPISSAFASHGMQWSAHVITAGAIAALCSTIMGSMISQPRILMAMARDGLLPLFFSDVNEHTQVPVKSSLLTGICIAVLAFFMDVSQLAGMVSVGTLLAFTIVAISILILRYVPRDEVPLPSSFQESPNPVSLQYSSSEDIDRKTRKYLIGTSSEYHQHFQRKGEALPGYPLIEKNDQKKLNEQDKQRIASWSIAFVCIGVLLMASAASAEFLTSLLRYSICGLGGLLLLCSVIALWWIGQDDARNHFGHTGGFQLGVWLVGLLQVTNIKTLAVFLCPFVPVLPAACIMINVYLMINLGAGTWIRVSVWMVVGVFIYLFYGRNHSLQQDTVYMPTAMADEICQSS